MPMDSEKLRQEQQFRLTMATARKMLENGLIVQQEYHEFEREMAQKYNPPIAGLTVKSA